MEAFAWQYTANSIKVVCKLCKITVNYERVRDDVDIAYFHL